MTCRLLYQGSTPGGISPYRIYDADDREADWLNRFLDAQHLRNLSPRSVRSYGYDLLNFLRWWQPRKPGLLSRMGDPGHPLFENLKPGTLLTGLHVEVLEERCFQTRKNPEKPGTLLTGQRAFLAAIP